MSLIDVRDAIVSRIQAEIPEFSDVQAHDGEFDGTEIARHFGHGPASARVVCLGMPEMQHVADEPVARGRYAVFIAAYSRTAADPNGPSTPGDTALALAQRVAELVHGERWNGQAYGEAERVLADNLYTAGLSKRGVSVWVVRWDQTVILDGRTQTNLDKLRTLHTDWELTDIGHGPELETTADLSLVLATQDGRSIITQSGDRLRVRTP